MEKRLVVVEGAVAELARHETPNGAFVRVKISEHVRASAVNGPGGEARQNVYVRQADAAGLALGTRVRVVMEVLS